MWAFSFYVLKQQPTDWLMPISISGQAAPSGRRFQLSGVVQAKEQRPGALAATDKTMKNYNLLVGEGQKRSMLDICYREARQHKFSVEGYDKHCYHRTTTILPLKQDFDKTIKEFEKKHSSESFLMKSSTRTGCVTFIKSADRNKDIATSVDFFYCPPQTDFTSISEEFFAFKLEKKANFYPEKINQLRGPFDTNVSHEHFYIAKDYPAVTYNADELINEINDNSRNGFVMVGYSTKYYDAKVN